MAPHWVRRTQSEAKLAPILVPAWLLAQSPIGANDAQESVGVRNAGAQKTRRFCCSRNAPLNSKMLCDNPHLGGIAVIQTTLVS